MRMVSLAIACLMISGCAEKNERVLAIPKSEARRKCVKCGWNRGIDDMGLKCASCSTVIVGEKANAKCPQCGAVHRAEHVWMTCAHCGKDVLEGGFMVGLLHERPTVKCVGCQKELTPADMVAACTCGAKIPGTEWMKCPKCAQKMSMTGICQTCVTFGLAK